MSTWNPALRQLRAWLAVLGLAVCLIASSSTPAHAHDQVTAQTPAAGEHLGISPGQVTLTFDGEPLPVGATILVVDADGNNWEDGKPDFNGITVYQKLRTPLPDGNYQVRWRIVSSDGHPISESFLFSVGDVTNAAPIPAPESKSEPVSTTDNANHGEFALEGATGEDSSGKPAALRTVLFAGMGAVVAVALFAVGRFLTSRSSRHPKGHTQ